MGGGTAKTGPVIPEVSEMMDKVLLLFTLVVGCAMVGQGRVLDDSVGTIQEGLEVIGQNPINDTVHVEEGEVDDGIARCSPVLNVECLCKLLHTA